MPIRWALLSCRSQILDTFLLEDTFVILTPVKMKRWFPPYSKLAQPHCAAEPVPVNLTELPT